MNRDDFYPMPGTYRDDAGHVRPLPPSGVPPSREEQAQQRRDSLRTAQLQHAHPFCPSCGSRAITAPVGGCVHPWHGRWAYEQWTDWGTDDHARPERIPVRQQVGLGGGVPLEDGRYWSSWWSGFLCGSIGLGTVALLLAVILLYWT